MMVRLDHVSFSFDDKTIFTDFSYEFPEGKITAVMAPSGSGKTTLLNLILGDLQPVSGKVTAPEKIAVSFQEPRLLPWFSVEENLKVVLKERNIKKAEVREIVSGYLRAVQLEAEMKSRPDELSGGMQKRVGLARALCYLKEENAGLLLLDEPFSGLDAALHQEMRALVKACAGGKTVILITHDEGDLEIADACLKL